MQMHKIKPNKPHKHMLKELSTQSLSSVLQIIFTTHYPNPLYFHHFLK